MGKFISHNGVIRENATFNKLRSIYAVYNTQQVRIKFTINTLKPVRVFKRRKHARKFAKR